MNVSSLCIKPITSTMNEISLIIQFDDFFSTFIDV